MMYAALLLLVQMLWMVAVAVKMILWHFDSLLVLVFVVPLLFDTKSALIVGHSLCWLYTMQSKRCLE